VIARALLVAAAVASGPASAGAATVSQAAHLLGSSRPAAFGQALAVSADGRTLAIGAPEARQDDGQVQIFTRVRGRWRPQGPPLLVDCRRRCGGAAGTGEDGNTFEFGAAIALSANGNTALIGAPGNGERGGVWVFARAHGRWRQQGARLIAFCHPDRRVCSGPNGTGLDGYAFGESVALSASGSVALIGAPGGIGGVFAFARSSGRWSQLGPKLIGSCNPARPGGCTGPNGTGEGYAGVNTGEFGTGVALSADGRTAVVGAGGDVDSGVEGAGAAWMFTRTGASWSQQGPKLVGAGEVGDGALGSSVALSADGNTALLGAPRDDNLAGAAWVFTRAAGAWAPQGARLVADCTIYCLGPNGTGEVNGSDGGAQFGSSVALTADGSHALIGAPDDGSCTCRLSFGAGAAWLFARSSTGIWSQPAPKIVGRGERNDRLGGQFGDAVALSGTGATALVGAPNDGCRGGCDGSIGNSGAGAAWLYALTF
jgi:hypothetical protein